MKKALLGILACACLSIQGMNSESTEQAHAPAEIPLTNALPYIFSCISTFYNNIAAFDPADQTYITDLHTWYCKMVVYQHEYANDDQCTMTAHDYASIMDQISYLTDKYNQFPPKHQEIEVVHATQDLNDYLSERLTRLMRHKRQLGKHQAQVIDDLHTWFHEAFHAFHEARVAEDQDMVMCKKLFDEVELGFDALEKRANIPSMKKPTLHTYRSPAWAAFQASPRVQTPKTTRK